MSPVGIRTVLAAAGAVVGLAAEPLAAGEIKGRVTLGGAPVAGVTVTAVTAETALERARREARRTPPAAPLASTVTRADGTFALAVAATTAKSFEVRLAGGG